MPCRFSFSGILSASSLPPFVRQSKPVHKKGTHPAAAAGGMCLSVFSVVTCARVLVRNGRVNISRRGPKSNWPPGNCLVLVSLPVNLYTAFTPCCYGNKKYTIPQEQCSLNLLRFLCVFSTTFTFYPYLFSIFLVFLTNISVLSLQGPYWIRL